MKIGFAKVNITPPIGVYMAGYFKRDKPSMNIHDPLYARAVIISDNEKVFSAVSVDTLGITYELSKLIEKYVHEQLGNLKIEISISATHTHSGPDLYGRYADFDKCLYEQTARKIASAIIMAYRNSIDNFEVYSNIGELEGITVNRRDPYRGVIDPKLHVIKFKGKFDIIISNYSCHAVVLGHNNYMISADYPGALNNFIERALNAYSIFFNGACGDINPYTPRTDLSKVYDRTVGTFSDVEWMGRILGCEVIKLTEFAGKIRNPKLNFICEELKVKTVKPPYSLSEVEELLSKAEEEYLKAIKEGKDASEERFKYITYKIAKVRLEKYSEEIAAPIKVLGLSSNLAMVFIPSEVLTRVGLIIKEKSPFKNTLVITYSNGYFGYIPTAEEYEIGGYEVSFPFSIVEKGTAELIINKVLEMLNELKTSYS